MKITIAQLNNTVGDIDDGGNAMNFVLKSSGIVISGRIKTINVEIGEFEKFRKIFLPDTSVTEIISVFDLVKSWVS